MSELICRWTCVRCGGEFEGRPPNVQAVLVLNEVFDERVNLRGYPQRVELRDEWELCFFCRHTVVNIINEFVRTPMDGEAERLFIWHHDREVRGAAYKMREDGLTFDQAAGAVGVDSNDLRSWLNDYPELSETFNNLSTPVEVV
jgi:hypothetical protein